MCNHGRVNPDTTACAIAKAVGCDVIFPRRRSPAASFDRVDRHGARADVYPHMDEVIFLVVLGALSIFYAAGWVAISLPKGQLSKGLSRITRAILAFAAIPLRGR